MVNSMTRLVMMWKRNCSIRYREEIQKEYKMGMFEIGVEENFPKSIKKKKLK